MRLLLAIAACGFFVVGVGAISNAKSDIQVIVAVLAFGFGCLLVGQIGVLKYLNDLARPPERIKVPNQR